MKDYKILALDETGKASFGHLSKNFILSGLILPEKFKSTLDKQARRIKKKYFNDEEIVFHCREILRKKGEFACLQDPTKEINFWSEFINLVNLKKVSFAIIVTNKEKARKMGWSKITILKRTYNKMLEEFTKKHLINSKGKIVAESDSAQDEFLIQAHNRLQGMGIPSEGISGSDYKNKITSLSLVNKLNLDIDIQMADSLAIMADVFYMMKMGENKKPTRVQVIMKRLINRKIGDKNNPGIFEVLI